MVITRVAPSPTGKFHIGTARAALFNYLYARKHKGTFILRIEDTDKERSKKEFEDDIKENFTWLGLAWDVFYRQSERISLYERYLRKLFDEGNIFWCFHQPSSTEGTVHICSSRDGKASHSKEQESRGVLRFRIRQRGQVVFQDLIRGSVRFETDTIGDFSVAKDFTEPLYNFANVIDDYEMKVTHVIRGEDHISNTPKQILLEEALGFAPPAYAHLPLVLGKDRSKLSKRHGAASVSEFRELGYLPEAMINFMVFLGWNPGNEREFFTLEELVKEFSLERVKRGGSIFDLDKLVFVNKHYIKTIPLEDLAMRVLPFLEAVYADAIKKYDKAMIMEMIALERERVETLSQFPDNFNFFFEEIDYPVTRLRWKNVSLHTIKERLTMVIEVIEKIPDTKYNEETIREILLEKAQEKGDRGEVLWPLRVALSGKEASSPPFGIAAILGKKETITRISYAISKITNEDKAADNR